MVLLSITADILTFKLYFVFIYFIIVEFENACFFVTNHDRALKILCRYVHDFGPK